MFLGHTYAGSCSDYAGAQKILDTASLTPTGRKRVGSMHHGGFPLASRNGSRSVRQESTGAIVFRLYQTDVVTWHSPTQVEVDATYQSVTTAAFASAFSPFSVGSSGEITFFQPERKGNDWRERWSSSQVVRGVVTFNLVAGGWVPDEDTCDEFRTFSVDRKLSRAHAAAHNIVDFATWLSMAPMHIDGLEHESYDPEMCAAALRRRDFKQAALLLPLLKDGKAFGTQSKPLNIACRYGEMVTMSSLARFRHWLNDDAGALVHHSAKVLSRRELEAGKKRNAALESAGVYDHMGWA